MTMSVLEKTLSKKTFSLPERVPQSLGLAPGAGSSFPLWKQIPCIGGIVLTLPCHLAAAAAAAGGSFPQIKG